MLSSIQPNVTLNAPKVAFPGQRQASLLSVPQADTVSIRFGNQEPASTKPNNDPAVLEDFFKAAIRGDVEAIKILLASGQVDVNAKGTRFQETVLHWAAKKGHNRLLGMLLAAGADINVGDRRDFTPLHYAVESNQAVAVQLLLNAGANFTLENKDGVTPLEIAVTGKKPGLVEQMFESSEFATKQNPQKQNAFLKATMLKISHDKPRR